MPIVGINPFGIRWAKFSSGERMPLLIRRIEGLPIEDVADWVTAERRVHKQARTLEADLEHLQFLYLWSEAYRVDFDERVTPSIDNERRLTGARFFTTEEMRSLCSFCGLHLGEAVKEYAEARFLYAPEWVPRQAAAITPIPCPSKPKRFGKIRRPLASNLVKRNRIQTTHAFLRYITGDYQRRLVVTGAAAAEEKYAIRRADCLAFLETQYKEIGIPSDVSKRKGLLPEVEARLREVIEPDHPENPWDSRLRVRNKLIVLMLLELAIRRGELLCIRTDDFEAAGRRCLINVHRRPDDPLDPRTEQPTTKTLARTLMAGEPLTKLLWDYITDVRGKVQGAKYHPFLIVDVSGGRPLSLSAVNKLFAALRARVIGLPDDLVPHGLRHTWNDNLSRAADKKKLSPEREEKLRTHQNGWSAKSKMAARYTKRHIEQEAHRISVEMQESMGRLHSFDVTGDA